MKEEKLKLYVNKELLIKNELRPLVYYLGMDGKWTDNGLQEMPSKQNQRLDLLKEDVNLLIGHSLVGESMEILKLLPHPFLV